MFFQPLEQFEVILGFKLSFFFFETIITNSFKFFFLIIMLWACINFFFYFKLYIIPTSFQLFLAFIYKFILLLLIEQAGLKSVNFFVFIFTLFFFILFSNFIGLIPFAFTLTSHILVTFSLGLPIIIGLTLLGFSMQGIHFLDLFMPKDVNKIIVPLLIIIEIVSYISRGFSLSIRLFANIMSGHTLLNILSSFIFMLFTVNKLLLIITFLVVFAICILEIALAFLQAYVFAVLTSIYLSDSLNSVAH